MICDKCKEPIKQVRTTQQNKSLHKFFTMISEQLNELGQEFCYSGITGKELSMPYTPHLVKEFFWKPIQYALFETNTTTKLDTKQMNTIIDVFTNFFADKGVVITFPSSEEIN